MKITHKIGLSIVLMGALHSVSAHEEPPEPSIGQQIDTAITAVKEFSSENKESAIEKVDSALSRLDKRIQVLEDKIQSKWQDMDSNARSEAQNSLETLHKNREQVASWMTELKASSSDTFKDIKTRVSGAFSALQDSWKKTEEDSASQNDKPAAKVITI